MNKAGRILFVLFFLLIITCAAWIYLSPNIPTSEAPEAEIPETPAAAPVVQEPEITIAAVGDIMLARKLTKLMDSHGTGYPFANTAELLSSADITFANLESPISNRGKKIPGKGIWFRGDPKNIEALTGAGFDVLSLANNHAVDYDSPALLDTIDLLAEAGIREVGAGQNITAARRPVILEVQGIKAAFLAYSEMTDMVWSYKYPRKLKAEEDNPGIAPLVLEQIQEDAAAIRPNVDLVIVSLHWGIEYQHQPQDYQREIAHTLIDSGVDVIIGHHPHCIQGVEMYNGGLIAYSLGNFVFDQNWSDQTRQGLLLQLKCKRDGWTEAELLPVYVNDGQPVIAEGDQADEILSLTRRISEDLGSEFLEAGTEEMNKLKIYRNEESI